jgi:hypothetical protein
MQAGWDAAVAECLNGHESCSYGGTSPSGGYWLADTECELSHHDHCAWCPSEPTTGFSGWAPDGWSIWAVPACEEHAAAWAAAHPEWTRPDKPEGRSGSASLGAVLADHRAAKAARLAAMPEELRQTWQAADRAAAENILLWGNPDGPGPGVQPEKLFDGLLSIFSQEES